MSDRDQTSEWLPPQPSFHPHLDLDPDPDLEEERDLDLSAEPAPARVGQDRHVDVFAKPARSSFYPHLDLDPDLKEDRDLDLSAEPAPARADRDPGVDVFAKPPQLRFLPHLDQDLEPDPDPDPDLEEDRDLDGYAEPTPARADRDPGVDVFAEPAQPSFHPHLDQDLEPDPDPDPDLEEDRDLDEYAEPAPVRVDRDPHVDMFAKPVPARVDPDPEPVAAPVDVAPPLASPPPVEAPPSVEAAGPVEAAAPANTGFAADGWTDDPVTVGEFMTDEDYTSTIDGTAAYSNGGHVGAALRRRRKLWCITAVAGLVIAMGAYVKYPPSYQATTSVLLVNNPTLDESEQIATDASLVTSGAVVQRVIGQLGLNESVGKFISSVVVTPPVTTTTDVITIAVSAPSSSDAVREANALSTDFLQFRAQMLQSQLQLDAGLLGQQISQAKSQADTINKQLSQLAQTPENQAEINNLQGQVDLATTTESNASATETTDQLNTSNMIKGSQVVNSAIVAPHTFKKDLGFYLAVGLVAGLVLGMAYVAIAALVSSRVRRRDDVADAIGAPVRLSVASADLAPVADTKRVVALLNGLVPGGSNGIRALAVVAVDNADIAARAVVALSQELSSRGEKVLLADLSDGTAAARILQVTTPGVRMVSTTGGPGIVVAVPEPDDIAPAGPLSGDLPPVGRVGERPPEPSVASAYSGADLLLTLATLDPATGGSHLATWATDAAVIVTAGKSSATKLNAVGEMIRLAGIRLGTVVLTGADKSDETVGLASRAADQYSPAS